MDVRLYATGETVFGQGEQGLELFVITSGTAQVLHTSLETPNEPPKVLATLGEGSAFGERAMVENKPRFAAVVATSPLLCYAISRTDFEAVVGPLRAH